MQHTYWRNMPVSKDIHAVESMRPRKCRCQHMFLSSLNAPCASCNNVDVHLAMQTKCIGVILVTFVLDPYLMNHKIYVFLMCYLLSYFVIQVYEYINMTNILKSRYRLTCFTLPWLPLAGEAFTFVRLMLIKLCLQFVSSYET